MIYKILTIGLKVAVFGLGCLAVYGIGMIVITLFK